MNLIKTLSQDAYDLCTSDEVFSFTQQKMILELQRKSLKDLKSIKGDSFSHRMLEMMDNYMKQLDDKLNDLDELILSEKYYYNTMPASALKAKLDKD